MTAYPSEYLLVLYYANHDVAARTRVVAATVPWFWGTAVYPPDAVLHARAATRRPARPMLWYVYEPGEPLPPAAERIHAFEHTLLDRCLRHDAQPFGGRRFGGDRCQRDKEDSVKGFRDFLNQGNVVQLAVAFVIGGAFGAVVTALVVDIVNPIIAIPFGKPNFDTLVLTVNGSNIKYGTFLTAVIAFVLVAAGVYFFFVVPYNRLQARTRSTQPGVEHAGLPRVPEHHSQGRSPLLVLHAAVEPQSGNGQTSVPEVHTAHLDELSPRTLLGILASVRTSSSSSRTACIRHRCSRRRGGDRAPLDRG